jgi:hypothetical protein
LSIFSTCTVFAAAYKVNQSGVVKSSGGKVISSPANTTNQNYYNNFDVSSYVASNEVNSTAADVIEIVMDYSGSMSNWITAAKRSMAAIIAQIPSTTRVGFRVFGHDSNGTNPTSIHTLQDVKKIVKNGNKFTVVTEKNPIGTIKGACSATTQVTPIISANSNSILAGMNSVDIGGATPLVYALDRAAYQDFGNMDTTSPKKIILITDGGENCGGDPCAFARNLMKKRSDIHIDVILASSFSKSLSCLASTTGGHLYNVNNLGDFSKTLTKTIQSQPATQQEIKKQSYEFIAE